MKPVGMGGALVLARRMMNPKMVKNCSRKKISESKSRNVTHIHERHGHSPTMTPLATLQLLLTWLACGPARQVGAIFHVDTAKHNWRNLVGGSHENPYVFKSPMPGQRMAEASFMPQSSQGTCRNFEIRIDIKPKGIINDWSNIFHFTTKDDCDAATDSNKYCRIPGLWITPNPPHTELYACVDSIDQNSVCIVGPPLPMGTWSHVVIQLYGNIWSMEVTDETGFLWESAPMFVKPLGQAHAIPYFSDPFSAASLVDVKEFNYGCLDMPETRALTLRNCGSTYTCHSKDAGIDRCISSGQNLAPASYIIGQQRCACMFVEDSPNSKYWMNSAVAGCGNRWGMIDCGRSTSSDAACASYCAMDTTVQNDLANWPGLIGYYKFDNPGNRGKNYGHRRVVQWTGEGPNVAGAGVSYSPECPPNYPTPIKCTYQGSGTSGGAVFEKTAAGWRCMSQGVSGVTHRAVIGCTNEFTHSEMAQIGPWVSGSQTVTCPRAMYAIWCTCRSNWGHCGGSGVGFAPALNSRSCSLNVGGNSQRQVMCVYGGSGPNDMTFHGSVFWKAYPGAPGGHSMRIQGSRDSNPSNGYGRIGYISADREITVCAWAKATFNDKYSYSWGHVSKYSHFILGESSTGRNMCFIVSRVGLSWQYGACYRPPRITRWIHWCGGYADSDGTTRIYMDGFERNSVQYLSEASVNGGGDHADVGHRECCAHGGLNAELDEVMIFDRHLGAAGVKNLFESYQCGSWTPLDATTFPTPIPSSEPTKSPVIIPTKYPTYSTNSPTAIPTKFPTPVPTSRPTAFPTPYHICYNIAIGDSGGGNFKAVQAPWSDAFDRYDQQYYPDTPPCGKVNTAISGTVMGTYTNADQCACRKRCHDTPSKACAAWKFTGSSCTLFSVITSVATVAGVYGEAMYYLHMQCPNPLTNANWIGNPDENNARFTVTWTDTTVIATRVDLVGPWTFPLQFQCCQVDAPYSGCHTVTVGSSGSGTKQVASPWHVLLSDEAGEDYMCGAGNTLDKDSWLNSDSGSEHFTIVPGDTQITVTRTNGAGWSMNLQMRCCKAKVPTQYPSPEPTKEPTRQPTKYPTPMPTFYPTLNPITTNPTPYPTGYPTTYPTPAPTNLPTRFPSPQPTKYPSLAPTGFPTHQPHDMCGNRNKVAVGPALATDTTVGDPCACRLACDSNLRCRAWQYKHTIGCFLKSARHLMNEASPTEGWAAGMSSNAYRNLLHNPDFEFDMDVTTYNYRVPVAWTSPTTGSVVIKQPSPPWQGDSTTSSDNGDYMLGIQGYQKKVEQTVDVEIGRTYAIEYLVGWRTITTTVGMPLIRLNGAVLVAAEPYPGARGFYSRSAEFVATTRTATITLELTMTSPASVDTSIFFDGLGLFEVTAAGPYGPVHPTMQPTPDNCETVNLGTSTSDSKTMSIGFKQNFVCPKKVIRNEPASEVWISDGILIPATGNKWVQNGDSWIIPQGHGSCGTAVPCSGLSEHTIVFPIICSQSGSIRFRLEKSATGGGDDSVHIRHGILKTENGVGYYNYSDSTYRVWHLSPHDAEGKYSWGRDSVTYTVEPGEQSLEISPREDGTYIRKLKIFNLYGAVCRFKTEVSVHLDVAQTATQITANRVEKNTTINGWWKPITFECCALSGGQTCGSALEIVGGTGTINGDCSTACCCQNTCEMSGLSPPCVAWQFQISNLQCTHYTIAGDYQVNGGFLSAANAHSNYNPTHTGCGEENKVLGGTGPGPTFCPDACCCEAKCDDSADCTGWNWVKSDSSRGDSSTCYLKTSANPTYSDDTDFHAGYPGRSRDTPQTYMQCRRPQQDCGSDYFNTCVDRRQALFTKADWYHQSWKPDGNYLWLEACHTQDGHGQCGRGGDDIEFRIMCDRPGTISLRAYGEFPSHLSDRLMVHIGEDRAPGSSATVWRAAATDWNTGSGGPGVSMWSQESLQYPVTPGIQIIGIQTAETGVRLNKLELRNNGADIPNRASCDFVSIGDTPTCLAACLYCPHESYTKTTGEHWPHTSMWKNDFDRAKPNEWVIKLRAGYFGGGSGWVRFQVSVGSSATVLKWDPAGAIVEGITSQTGMGFTMENKMYQTAHIVLRETLSHSLVVMQHNQRFQLDWTGVASTWTEARSDIVVRAVTLAGNSATLVEGTMLSQPTISGQPHKAHYILDSIEGPFHSLSEMPKLNP